MNRFSSIETVVNKQRNEQKSEVVIEPINALHALRIEAREAELPEAPKEKVEIPLIPDMKKAEEDYNSVDYQIIAFNLWKSKAREAF